MNLLQRLTHFRALRMGCLLALVKSALVGGILAADVDFQADIQPLLETHCIDCHGTSEINGGLRLDGRAAMLRGGDSGQAALVPGDPAASLLLQAVLGHDDLVMPPDGPGLAEGEIEKLRRWIAQGATWPGQMQATADTIESDWWSLQPLPLSAQAGGPTAETALPLKARIDELVAQRLATAGLSRAEPTDPINLLRRASLVVTGLPPTPAEVDQFASDLAARGHEAAYAAAIERLLASPGYGERWAQHWLDVIRWAESVGFETNAERPNAWPYRDWVIDSLNIDKPYDQFLFEQIAGDTVGQDAALGFLVAGPANLPGQIGRDEEAMRQARQDELDEIIRTVSQAVCGLTVGCARCHNHKFDPILQRDYYAMQAVFAGTFYGDRRLRGPENEVWAKQVPAAQQQLDQLLADSAAMRERLGLLEPLEDLHTDRFDAVRASAVRMEIVATGNRSAASLYEFQCWTAEPAGGKGAPSRNVALASQGATASASSFALANQTRHFDNLIDGSSDRRQAFPWVAAKSGAAWIQIDFAEAVMIDRVVWDRGSSLPAEYRIQVLIEDAILDETGAGRAQGDAADTAHWVTVADSLRRWPREDDSRPVSDVRLRDVEPQDIESVVTLLAEIRSARAKLSRLSRGPQVFAATFAEPAPTWLLSRGDPMSRREVVPPAVPRVLGDLGLDQAATDQQRRVALAQHLTDPQHPLTARVIANRVWQHHFGIGLVDTPSDFGRMGSQPTHPQLLDALATHLVTNHWSLKSLHRQILLSQTFQQSSRPRVDGLQADAESRLLWRFPPRRMEAEAIRDSMLLVSGKLNRQRGGRGFDLFRQRGGLTDYQPLETFDAAGWRRMVYAHKIRMQEVDVFGAFDCPDAGQMKPRRTVSITPTQSLGLFNSPFTLRQSEFFRDRILQELEQASDDTRLQVERAMQIALGREPTEDERTVLNELVESEGLEQLCRVLFNSSEFLTIR